MLIRDNGPTAVWHNLWLAGSACPFPTTPVDLDVCICLERERWFSPQATRSVFLPLTEDQLLLPENRSELEDAAQQVVWALRADQKVIVRCKWGVERSALVAALALMTLTGATPDKVVEHLRHYRGSDVLDPARGDFLGWLGAGR